MDDNTSLNVFNSVYSGTFIMNLASNGIYVCYEQSIMSPWRLHYTVFPQWFLLIMDLDLACQNNPIQIQNKQPKIKTKTNKIQIVYEK
jgi:hypothetical protein